MNRIQNTIENGGINKITFRPIAEGSAVSNIFARYEKETHYNDGSVQTEYVERMSSERNMGLFGFYYAGNRAGTFTWIFDGIERVEEPKVQAEVWF